jgi:hypothetical protein
VRRAGGSSAPDRRAAAVPQPVGVIDASGGFAGRFATCTFGDRLFDETSAVDPLPIGEAAVAARAPFAQ